jgi:CDP-glucose 4,6-dehydratase
VEGLVTRDAARLRLAFRDSRVLVTGHTGFKGAWLCEWLLQIGARVSGVALPPDSPDSLFSRLKLEKRLDHHVCDVRDPNAVRAVVRAVDPEIVIHMAAQSLVRRSYREPLLTFQTNVDGTLNVLEAVRALGAPVVVVAVTTDKVYKNREWEHAYRETDELGGHDPYSASKAACELAVAAWRSSFGKESHVGVATARAGNVIGAGDISEDRIVPDCFRAWSRGAAVEVRNPASTRPWQHVLEPLSGYLALAAYLRAGHELDTCNFGPGDGGERTVEALVKTLVGLDPKRRWVAAGGGGAHEARALALAIDRARLTLKWAPRLGFEEALEWTNEGYVAADAGLAKIIERQIASFEARQ